MTINYYAGIDLGTSGCRVIIIDEQHTIVAETRVTYPAHADQTPDLWWSAVQECLAQLPSDARDNIAYTAVDGTSGTILLTDAQGKPTSPALMYNDNRACEQAQRIAAIAPDKSGAHGATSSLAKLLWLLEHHPNDHHTHALHQADWIAGKLAGHFGFSDENNCLKLGYDPITRSWSDWLTSLVPEYLLPTVYPPGTPIPNTTIKAGTTDSIAAFIATGAKHTGDAVTSLGSSIALKVISDKPVFSPEYGIYSHRLGNMWLAGGASNTGGAVLLQHFSREQLAALTPQLDPQHPTGLDYYPLTQPGERFPVADPTLQPRLTPRPANDVQFLQGMLEGMTRIEHQGWQRLHELGAPYPRTLRTVGGGSQNPAWTTMREQYIGVQNITPPHTEAAYGAALLAAT